MKYLSHYIEEKQTALFDKLGVFFAFSNEQLAEKQVEGVTYVSMGAGMIAPKENASEVAKGLNTIHAQGIAEDIAENGLSAIIQRELANHEACYTYDWTDTYEALGGYGVTKEQMQSEFAIHVTKCENF